jgi:hypothetical protein
MLPVYSIVKSTHLYSLAGNFPNLAGVYPLLVSWEHWPKILEMLSEDKQAPVSDKQTG